MAHIIGKIDMMIHLSGGAPVEFWGEVVSICRGAMVGHTGYLEFTSEGFYTRSSQRIETFLTTSPVRKGRGIKLPENITRWVGFRLTFEQGHVYL